jgi:hypothetical protein
MSESTYKYWTSGKDGVEERIANRASTEERQKKYSEMKAKEYVLCSQRVNDHEVAYWYAPNDSSNANEWGR